MQKHSGRIRWRLAKLLAEKGIVVSPYDLWTQEGGYRRHTWDLARWGTSDARWEGGKAPDGTPWGSTFSISSWSTMTDCVRHGIDMGKEDKFGMWNAVAVEAADPRPKPKPKR